MRGDLRGDWKRSGDCWPVAQAPRGAMSTSSESVHIPTAAEAADHLRSGGGPHHRHECEPSLRAHRERAAREDRQPRPSNHRRVPGDARLRRRLPGSQRGCGMSRRPGRNNGYIRKRESRSGKTRYEARHEFSDAYGKRFSESQTFATRRDASLWIAARKRRYGRGELSREHRDITLGEYLDVYLVRRQAEGLAASSLRDISSAMRLYGAELTPLELRSITSTDIDRALSRAMNSPTRTGAPRSPKTVAKFRSILSKIFATALVAGMLDGGNPVDASLRPGRASVLAQTPDAWSQEEIQQFFDFCETAGVGSGQHRHALAFRLLLDTGCASANSSLSAGGTSTSTIRRSGSFGRTPGTTIPWRTRTRIMDGRRDTPSHRSRLPAHGRLSSEPR